MHTNIVNRTSQFFSVCSLEDLVKSITPQQKMIAIVVTAALATFALGFILYKKFWSKVDEKEATDADKKATTAATDAIKKEEDKTVKA